MTEKSMSPVVLRALTYPVRFLGALEILVLVVHFSADFSASAVVVGLAFWSSLDWKESLLRGWDDRDF